MRQRQSHSTNLFRAGHRAANSRPLPLLLAALFFSGASNIAQAGRPLTVDDAGTDDAKTGHVEAWLDKQGNTDNWNVAPTYAPVAGLEISIPFAQQRSKLSGSTEITKQIGLGLKWVPFQNEAVWSAGVSATVLRNTAPDAVFEHITVLNSIFSYSFSDAFALHLNVGLQKNGAEKANITWGIALERGIGNVTAHIESFGAAKSKPTTQIGLRYAISRTVQIDGTIGRATVATAAGTDAGDGPIQNSVRNIGSIGLKIDF